MAELTAILSALRHVSSMGATRVIVAVHLVSTGVSSSNPCSSWVTWIRVVLNAEPQFELILTQLNALHSYFKETQDNNLLLYFHQCQD